MIWQCVDSFYMGSGVSRKARGLAEQSRRGIIDDASLYAFCFLLFLLIRTPSLSDVGGNVLVSRSISNSLINLALGSTSSLKLVCLGLSGDQLTVRSDGM